MQRALLGSRLALAALAALASVASVAASAALVCAGCETDAGTNAFPPLSQHPGSPGSEGGIAADAGIADDATIVPASVASACADFAAARCKRDDACTGGLHNVAVYGDEPTCEARTSALCVLDLTAPSTAQTPVVVEACAGSIAAQSCADFFDGVPTAACTPVAGSLTTGAACIAGSQCTSSYCAVGPNAVCGSCAPVPKSGDHCATDDECGNRDRLACAGSVCIPLGQASSPCTSAIPCGYGLTCVGETGTAPGTCQIASGDAGVAIYATSGKPCGNLDGGVVACAAGACVIASVDGGAPTDAGADAIADGGDGGDAASDAGPAVQPGPPTNGTCVGAVREGVACDLAHGPPCLLPAKCVSAGDGGTAGTCALPSGGTCK